MNYDTADSHIYYDISIFNNDTSGDMPVNLKFSEVRSGGSLLDNPSDYLFSIVRFEMDSVKLPVFIPEALAGSLNDLIYTIVIETIIKDAGGEITGTNIYKRRVVFVPTNPNIDIPNPSNDNFSNEYYFIYNIQRWVDMVNTCFRTIHALIVSAGEFSGLNILPPFFSYDGNTGKVNLYTSREYVDGYASTLDINLYWNAPMETIFGGFDTVQISKEKSATFDAQSPVQSGTHTSTYYQVHVRNENNINTKNLGVGSSTAYFVETKQGYASFPLCNPIQNIVFTTSGNLPISYAQTASPVIFTSKGDCALQGRSDNISPILTDFIVPLTTGNEYKPKINYSPSVYRLLDLKGNNPIKNCDLQVYWKSKIDSKLHPFVLGSQCGASCKIMFRKKQFDNL